MSEYNIQMNKYNASNAGYDQLFPATKIANVDGLGTALQNKAPAGYGLGGNAKPLTSADDLNAIWRSGYYGWHSSSIPKNTPELKGLVADAFIMHVCGSGENAYCQEIIPITNGEGHTTANNNKFVRSRYGNVIKGWDWVNPPMLLGVEYRTAERYQGKPVYVEAVDFGAMPNSTNKTLWSSPANNADKIIDFGGEGGGNSFPTGDNAITMTAAITSSKTIAFTITTKSNFSSYNATVWAKYTKTTD